MLKSLLTFPLPLCAMILHVNCTRKCTRKTGSIVRHEAFNIVLCFLVVLRFFLFDGVLIRRFQHIVCGVSHALHGVFVRNTNGQHSGGIDVAEVVGCRPGYGAFLSRCMFLCLFGWGHPLPKRLPDGFSECRHQCPAIPDLVSQTAGGPTRPPA